MRRGKRRFGKVFLHDFYVSWYGIYQVFTPLPFARASVSLETD
jgi:hypothetical protein